MVDIIRNISLPGEPKHPDRCVSLFLPQQPSTTNTPILVFVHGGAWVTGHVDEFEFVGEAFAGRGFPTVVAGYRLSRRGPSPSDQQSGQPTQQQPTLVESKDKFVQHPDHLRDVADAIEWTATHSHNHLPSPPTSIILVGHSAGAHLITMSLLNTHHAVISNATRSLIHAVVGVSGIYDIPKLAEVYPVYVPWFIVPVFTESREEWVRASPMHISSTTTDNNNTDTDRDLSHLKSVLIVHAGQDKLVPIDQSIQFINTLHNLGINNIVTRFDLMVGHDEILKSDSFYDTVTEFVKM